MSESDRHGESSFYMQYQYLTLHERKFVKFRLVRSGTITVNVLNDEFFVHGASVP